MLRFLLRALIFIVLTLLTQVGGIAYLLALFFSPKSQQSTLRRTFRIAALTIGIYIGVSALTYAIAPYFGRTALPCFITSDAKLAMQSPLYCALNRHYVAPKLKSVAKEFAQHIDNKFPGTITLVLDANFPFLNGFPLFPHLSHDDGKKLDLAFYYRDQNGVYVRGKTKSPIGYWAFEEPRVSRQVICARQTNHFSLRWDVPWFKAYLRDLALEPKRTYAALKWLTTVGPRRGVSRIFLEPHLARAFSIHGSILRFQGCNAARYDDHIHIEIAP